jgi:hypothetical protein
MGFDQVFGFALYAILYVMALGEQPGQRGVLAYHIQYGHVPCVVTCIDSQLRPSPLEYKRIAPRQQTMLEAMDTCCIGWPERPNYLRI